MRSRPSPREALSSVYSAAIEAVHGGVLLRRHSRVERDTWHYDGPGGPGELGLPGPGSGGRVVVVGAGKAAAALADGIEHALGERIDSGVVVVKYGHGVPLRRIRVLEAAHPVPDASGERATREIIAKLAQLRRGDCAFVLLTGGASALLVAPAKGLTLGDKSRAHAELVRSGATIHEINVVRKQLSAVKGGRLAEHAREARLCTIAISDVPGDDPATIGSGPTVADTSTRGEAMAILVRHGLTGRLPAAVLAHLGGSSQDHVAGVPEAAARCSGALAPGNTQYLMVGNNAQALGAAAGRARELGFTVYRYGRTLTGETHEEARAFAAEMGRIARERSRGTGPALLLAGGETTMQIRGTGLGGRSQEFALEAARSLGTAPGACHLLAAGTDGTDGPTDAAGAYADSTTLARASRAGLDADRALRDNDCYPFFRALGDLFVTGATGTNVMDVVFGMVGSGTTAGGE